MAEGSSGSRLAVSPSKRDFPFSRRSFMILFSLLLVMIAAVASEAKEARSQTPEPAPSPPANAKFVPGPSELWTAVDYTEGGSPIVADELIVRFRDGVPEEEREAILSEAAAQTKSVLEFSDIRVVKVDPAEREQILKELSSNENIESVGRNQIARLLTSPRKEANDYHPDSPWHLLDIQEFPSNQNMESLARNQIAQPPPPPRREPNDYDPDSLWHLENIWAPEGWFINDGSSSKYIAIVDSGVDYTHPDLAGKVIKDKDFVDGGWDPMDEHGHGTAAAGAAAAMTDNGTGIAAAAWQPKILAIRISDDNGEASLESIAKGIERAIVVGADVINLSIAWSEHDEPIYQQLLDAVDAGIIVIAGSGPPDEEHPCDMWYPANYHEVVAVSAVDRNDLYAVGCGTGQPTPCGDSKAGPDVVAPGEDVLTTALGGGYGLGTGTSFASAIVAGTAAMMLNCTSDAEFVKHAIASTADDLVAPGPGFDEWTGWGRISLFNALLEACSPAPTINVTATPNPLPSPGDPVTIEISAFDSDSDLALVQYYIENDSGGTWSHLMPGVDPDCDSSSCVATIWLFDTFITPDWKYRITAAAYDEAGHMRTFCAYNCPNNDLPIDDNNWYYLVVGDGSGSSAPVQADQSVAPYLQEPTASTGDTITVNLDWTDTEGEAAFAIQKKVGTGLFADVATVSAGITEYSDPLPSSQEGETLTYRVRAKFPDGSRSLSNEPSIDAPTSPDDPTSSPLDATVYCTGWGEIGIFTPWAWLEWDAKAGYTGQYKVQHRKSGESWSTQLTGGTDFSIALDNNSTYQFKVLLADNTLWAGPETRSVSCEDPEPPEPGAGDLRVDSQYCMYGRAKVVLRWNEYEHPGPTYYEVHMKYPGDQVFYEVETTTSPIGLTIDRDVLDRPLRDDTEIGWKVVIEYYFEEIDWGGPVYAVTPACKPDIVAESLQVLPIDGSSRIEPGEQVEGVLWLKNDSDQYAHSPAGLPFKINLWADRPVAPSFGDHDHDAQVAATLAPHEQEQVTISFTAPATVGSNKRAWVLADGYDQVWELDEDNNSVNAYYTVSAPPPPCDSFADVDDDGYVTYLDIDKILEFIAEAPPPTPEEKLKADIDGDGEVTQADIDGITDYLDGLAYTVPVCEDLDDDGLPNYEDDDDDNDGFDDSVEVYVGTDPYDDCPDDLDDDAWPPDVNGGAGCGVTHDGEVNVLDVLCFKGKLDPDPYDPRYDLNADGSVNILDVLLYKPIMQTQCTNPPE